MDKFRRARVRADALYCVGYAMLLGINFLFTTTFREAIPHIVVPIIRVSAYMFFLYRVFVIRVVRRKLFLVGIIMAAVSVISWYSSGYAALLDYSITCICAVEIDFKKIVKTYLYVTCTLTVLTIVAAILGYITNYVYYRHGVIRMAMGFVYPTDFAAHIFFIAVAFSYLFYDKVNVFFVMAYSALAYIMYRITNSRGPCSMIAIISVVLFVYKWGSDRGLSFLPKWLIKFSTVICAAITMVLINAYDSSSASWTWLDRIMTRRLSYAARIMDNNRITLFGQYIKQRGDGLGGRAAGVEYTFIDLSFQRILLMYGLILFVFLLVYSVLLNEKSLKERKIVVPLLMFVVSFYSLTAQHYFDYAYNFILLAYFANVSASENREASNMVIGQTLSVVKEKRRVVVFNKSGRV